MQEENVNNEKYQRIKDHWWELTNRIKKDYCISGITYNTWIAPLSIYSFSDGQAVISVDASTDFYEDYLSRKYTEVFQTAISELLGEMVSVDFKLKEGLDSEIRESDTHQGSDDTHVDEAERLDAGKFSMLKKYWKKLIMHIRKEYGVSRVVYEIWLAPLSPYSISNGIVTISVNSDYPSAAEYISRSYMDLFRSAIGELFGEPVSVKFQLKKELEEEYIQRERMRAGIIDAIVRFGQSMGLRDDQILGYLLEEYNLAPEEVPKLS